MIELPHFRAAGSDHTSKNFCDRRDSVRVLIKDFLGKKILKSYGFWNWLRKESFHGKDPYEIDLYKDHEFEAEVENEQAENK